MEFIYFFYGLAFFTSGICILVYPKQSSNFQLGKTLVFLALFMTIHGIHEWVEMFALIRAPSRSVLLDILDLATLPLSFFCLTTFGVEVIAREQRGFSGIRAMPILLLLGWTAITMWSRSHLVAGNIAARYLLGFPGSVLTSYALLCQVPDFRVSRPPIKWDLWVASGTFLLYAILSGLIVPSAATYPASVINYTWFADTFGIPVQVPRTICAIVISFNVLSLLRLFGWEVEDRMLSLSLKDDLTGLYNRRGFFTLAEEMLKSARRERASLVLHMGDIDNLKSINDKLGHKAGDTALIEAADILKQTFRESDIVSRIGGDEFAVLQTDGSDVDPVASIGRLRKTLSERNSRQGRQFDLSISIGSVRCSSDDANSFDKLVALADNLMYEQKRRKQGR